MIDRQLRELRPTSLLLFLLRLVLPHPSAARSRRRNGPSARARLRDVATIVAATGTVALVLAPRRAKPVGLTSNRALPAEPLPLPGPTTSMARPSSDGPSAAPASGPSIRPAALARRSRLPAGRRRALTVVAATFLALAVLPTAVGSYGSTPIGPLSAAAFRPLDPPLAGAPRPTLDPAAGAAAALTQDQLLLEPATPSPAGRAAVPGVVASPSARLRYPIVASSIGSVAGASAQGRVLSGWASWYDNGTTAMRLPRGTIVQVCGPAACVTRGVTDYGPDPSIFPQRIVDMMPADFATVCGCSTARGTVYVMVTIL